MPTEADSLTDWLETKWPSEGPAVVIIEGFSGVGKSRIGRELVQRWKSSALGIEVPEETIGLQDLLLDVAARFEEIGDTTMSGRDDLDLVAGLRSMMRAGSLLVVDDAHLMLDPSTRLPSTGLLTLVRAVTDRATTGRLLLITNQAPAEGVWLENVRRLVLRAPSPQEATALLDVLLKDRGKEEEVPEEKREDVVRWLGGNPRALRALVACLDEEPLDTLIEIEPDAWLLRDEVVSPQLIQKLEAYFLTRTLDQLDSNASLLLELLSVYRKPFRADAVDRLKSVVDVATARESLSSRYLISLHNGYFAIHPVMRRLARVRLSEMPRREQSAHRAAADHFSRRFRGGSVQTNLATVGEAFVESRYHLLTVGRDSDFEAIASDYRRQLLSHYSGTTRVPASPLARRQLLSTLQAALSENDRGYAALRVILARLLLQRGQHDDDRIALRQLTLASRESKDLYCWKTRLELTSVLEGLTAGRAVAEQALKALHESHHWMIFHSYASVLIARKRDTEALTWLEKGLNQVPTRNLYSIYSLSSFVLARDLRRAEAVDLLLSGYETLSAQDQNSWRLAEEAAFIAAAVRDGEKLAKVRAAGLDDNNKRLVGLCDVLALQMKGRYRDAAFLAEGFSSAALTAQAAFGFLCAGDVQRATRIVINKRLPQNRAAAWIKALTALCARRPDLYAEEMANCLGRQLTEDESNDPALWLYAWDEIPDRLESFPSFYFPRLPPSLTNLEVELVRLVEHGPVSSTVDISVVQLPTLIETSDPEPNLDNLSVDYASAPLLLNFNGDLVMNRDTYNVSGQTGSVGPGASVRGSTFNQFVSSLNEGQLAHLATELSQLRESMRRTANSAEEDMAVAEIARAEVAAAEGDAATVERHLSKAGRWALSTATTIGTALAAAALKAALGL